MGSDFCFGWDKIQAAQAAEMSFLMEITYALVEDYLLPDIALQEKPPSDGYGEPLGRYARS